jgi:phosphomannomutase/phosphoglucomutase
MAKLLDEKKDSSLSEIKDSLPITYQSPTLAPYCADDEKYQVVDEMIDKIDSMFLNNESINNQKIKNIITVNGIRFELENGSWGLIRASSNKPSLVIVIESLRSNDEVKEIFDFINSLLDTTGKVGEYDQSI